MHTNNEAKLNCCDGSYRFCDRCLDEESAS